MAGDKDSTIHLPLDLTEAIQKKIQGTAFDSVSTYVTYVLRQVLKQDSGAKPKERELTNEEKEKVKKNLQAMGYAP